MNQCAACRSVDNETNATFGIAKRRKGREIRERLIFCYLVGTREKKRKKKSKKKKNQFTRITLIIRPICVELERNQ